MRWDSVDTSLVYNAADQLGKFPLKIRQLISTSMEGSRSLDFYYGMFTGVATVLRVLEDEEREDWKLADAKQMLFCMRSYLADLCERRNNAREVGKDEELPPADPTTITLTCKGSAHWHVNEDCAGGAARALRLAATKMAELDGDLKSAVILVPNEPKTEEDATPSEEELKLITDDFPKEDRLKDELVFMRHGVEWLQSMATEIPEAAIAYTTKLYALDQPLDYYKAVLAELLGQALSLDETARSMQAQMASGDRAALSLYGFQRMLVTKAWILWQHLKSNGVSYGEQ